MKKGILGDFGEGDAKEVEKFKLFFLEKSDKELAEIYFTQQKVGITGVRMQLYFLIALKFELRRRFGQDPINIDGNLIEFI